MADFFQNGIIATLQKLKERPLQAMEEELQRFSEEQKIALLLPALYSEFEGEAMPAIIQELEGADYLHRIILSLDRADREQFEDVKHRMSVLPAEVSILWNDGPRISALIKELEGANFPVAQQGKGRGVWMAMGLALTDKDVHTIALHDCDILNYSREMLVRLLYPIVHPATDFEFSKGFYPRITDRLYGRVTRLFFTPLIRSLKQLLGEHRFLYFLDSFRYALSGEFAFIRSLAKGIQISPGWGLEVSMLGEVYANTTVDRVCQVEIAETYNHKHRELSKGDLGRGLSAMSVDIAQDLFRILAQGGLIFSDAFFRSLQASYPQRARWAIERYHALALINGLEYDRHAEIEAAETFNRALREATEKFKREPVGARPMAAWVRVRAGLPEFPYQLREAVELDNG
ncbi:MAG: glycosyl transferase [Acidobacteria bacterium]|nr:MAG: glycosyl transferase [Acidobacteriota bacterium]